jgi:hypothetical protein
LSSVFYPGDEEEIPFNLPDAKGERVRIKVLYVERTIAIYDLF